MSGFEHHYTEAEECFATTEDHGPTREDGTPWTELGIGHALLAIAHTLHHDPNDPPTPAIPVSQGDDHHPRIDRVTTSPNGLEIWNGTPHTDPVPPAVPADRRTLRDIWVPAQAPPTTLSDLTRNYGPL